MPEYTFEDTKTGKVETVVMTIAQREEYLKKNPHIMQLIIAPNGFIPGHGNKPDGVFRDMLREMKKRNPGSTIETW